MFTQGETSIKLSRIQIIYVIVAVAFCLAGALYLFPRAFPLASLSLLVDRDEVCEIARTEASAHNIGPEQFDQAISFISDNEGMIFIERHDDGHEKLRALMKENLYFPYLWQVRHFAEYETHEAHFFIRPNGTVQGFQEILSEDTPGPTLEVEKARTIAESETAKLKLVDFNSYTLIQHSSELKKSGRRDYVFTYEYTQKIYDGALRVELVLSGNKLTGVRHFVYIPEQFEKEYEYARSLNGGISSITMLLWFMFILCMSLAVLYRVKNQLLIRLRPTVLISAFFALFMLLIRYNALPLLFNSYHTAIGKKIFLMQFFVSSMISAVVLFLQFFLFFFVGFAILSLVHQGRARSFFSMIVGNADLQSSVLIGYLFAAISLFYVPLLYFFTGTYGKWWVPTDLLADPNTLAMYIPILNPLCNALQAGIVEEILFRAIPIYGTLILFAKSPKRNKALIVILCMQALFFGAAHASYPQQPYYARIIELFFPSLLWGIALLRIGIVPLFVSHFLYDFCLMSIPILVNSAPGSLYGKLAFICISMLPLILAKFANKYSHYFERDAAEERVFFKAKIDRLHTGPDKINLLGAIFCGLIGLILFFLFSSFKLPQPQLTDTRKTSYAICDEARLKKDTVLLSSFDPAEQSLPAARYIIQKHPELYSALVSDYFLPTAHFLLRAAQFSGPITERIFEEVFVVRDRRIIAYHATYPESEQGVMLTEVEAEVRVRDFISTQYHPDQNTLEKISATLEKRPHRLDWLFKFKDTRFPFSDGAKAIIEVGIAGDKLTLIEKKFEAPELWQREDQEKNTIAFTLRGLAFLILFILLLSGAVIFFAHLDILPFLQRKRQQVFIFLFVAITLLLHYGNRYESYLLFLRPTKSLALQCMLIAITIFLRWSALSALITSSLCYFRTNAQKFISFFPLFGAGFLIPGLESLFRAMIAPVEPLSQKLFDLNAIVPLFAGVVSILNLFFLITLCYVLFAFLLRVFERRYQLFIPLFSVLFHCGLIPLFFMNDLTNFTLWGTLSLTIGTTWYPLYRFYFRYNYSLLIPFVAGMLTLSFVRELLMNPFAGALISYTVLLIILNGIALIWYAVANQKLNVFKSA